MKRRLRFKRAELTETTEQLQNPARGWYQVYSFRAEDEPDFGELEWCLNKEETCALVLFDIGAYKSRDLDDDAIRHIRRILAFFDTHKRDVILRAAYDTEGKAVEHEPSVFSQVISHIRQLGDAVMEYAGRILLFEGMLAGNWGEMHGSRFLTKKYMSQLNEAMAQSFPGIMRAVRRPVQWRMLHGEHPGKGTMVGLYDDAIFGSDTDLGTFAVDSGVEADPVWEEPWYAEQELDFEHQLSLFVPQCGEAVYGEAYSSCTLASTVERLRKMGLSYLNGVYDENILRIWRGWQWNAPDIWQGMNGYDYIGRHLGYRFCVRYVGMRQQGDFCELTLTVENTGFSGFYQEAEVCLILSGGDGEETEYKTDWDVREWKSGQTSSLTWRLPCREGKLWLSARRKWDHEMIRFANVSTEQGRVLVGEILR